jgi:hypothetical protein
MLGLHPPQELGQDHHIKTDRMNINLEVVQRWLSVCDSDHQAECRNRIKRQFLSQPPSLILIDIQSQCISITTAQLRYTALSYVWGKSDDVFATTTLNKHQLCEKGSLSSRWDKLPATVQDAILLTKALKIPFLWVDRLCIVQDDDESLKHNISWMASIYANAYFTIIATEGVDDEFGLRGIGSTSGPRDFFPFFQFEDIELAQEGLFENEQVWHSRAWTFQERAVSRRCLVFFRGTVKWECQECEHHEHLNSSTWLTDQKSYPRHNISLVPWPDYEQYSTLCSGFSNRNIRHQEDALKAFTAVINSFAPSFPGGFIYALPEFAFDLALAWTHENVASRRPMFPSWSWIGWNGATRMQDWTLSLFREKNSRRPMVQWGKKRLDTGSMELINNSYHLWSMFENDASITPPKGWKREFFKDGEVYYRYDGDLPRTYQNGLNFNYKHPLPITSDTGPFSIPSDIIVSEPFLYGIVQSITCTLGESIERRPPLWKRSKPNTLLLVNIHNRQGSWIGTMETNTTNSSAYTPGTECVVIAISHVTHKRESWNEMEELITQSHLAAETSYNFIQVLWVSWEGSIAYRRGLGRIWEKAWKQEENREIKIVLG